MDLLERKFPKKTRSITKTLNVPVSEEMAEAIRVFKATVKDDDFNEKAREFFSLVLERAGLWDSQKSA